jgi:hypothetical protein
MREMKTYNKDGVQYGFNIKHKKWNFDIGEIHLISVAPGGKDTAEKIAGQIAGAHKRAKTLDAMARGTINKLIGFARLDVRKTCFDFGGHVA